MTAGLNPIIADAIQLAVAPVFLMTAIAGRLGVMANRLARVIDWARALEAAWDGLSEPAREAALAEFRSLERRRHFASWAINFCAIAALIVCIVITTLFLEEFFQANLIRSPAGCSSAPWSRRSGACVILARGIPRDELDPNRGCAVSGGKR